SCKVAPGFTDRRHSCQGIRDRFAVNNQNAFVPGANLGDKALGHNELTAVVSQSLQNDADIWIVAATTKDAAATHSIERFENNILVLAMKITQLSAGPADQH